ncbi:MAG TPA: Gmad2 immunoglobulin-like domain-containing protein [Nitrolancea sp.]|nr:Gmad2 immunoglobulin-like domain-containing protein [Nitrolancea sp.]
MRAGRRLAYLGLVLVVALALAACGNGSSSSGTATQGRAASTTTPAPTTAPTAAPSPAATAAATAATAAPTTAATPAATAATTATASPTAQEQAVTAYLLQGGKVWPVSRPIAHTLEVARAAMTELLAGPSQSEQAAGLSTSIPAGTTLRGVTIANGVATVDLSAEFTGAGGGPLAARLAQVIYTLTQFNNVQAVTVRVGGQPLSPPPGTPVPTQSAKRDDFEDETPAILIERPLLGATVTSPVRVAGSANVFEAQFVVQVQDAHGKVLKEVQARATSGTGQRGTFDLEVPFSVSGSQPGMIVAFDLSAKDGSKIDEVKVPVTLAP